jgi:hypothetical protein
MSGLHFTEKDYKIIDELLKKETNDAIDTSRSK